jgi:THO complex subunit 2 N-terminus/Transcription- and export-related complex subunit
MSLVLPSSTEIKAAVIKAVQSQNQNGGDADNGNDGKMDAGTIDVIDQIGTDGSCEQLLVQALEYGTKLSIDGGIDDVMAGGDEASLLLSRNEETIEVLTESWRTCPALEDPLVDALWLTSTLLSSSEEQHRTLSGSSKEGNAASGSTGGGGGGAIMNGSSLSSPSMKAFVAILSALVREHTVPEDPERVSRFVQKLQANIFPVSVLEDAGALPSPSTNTGSSSDELLKKLRVYNTTTYYKQIKYNLLHDASEGYANVLQYLVNRSMCCQGDGEEEECEDNRLRRQSELMKLIGTFDLDPNRVLDLTLDVLEGTLYPSSDRSTNTFQTNGPGPIHKPVITPSVRWLLGVMRELASDKLPPLIAFKLSGDRRASNVAETKEVATKLCMSMTRTAAFLVSEGMVDLKTLVLQFCSPKLQSEIEETYNIAWQLEKVEIQSLTRISKPADSPKILQQREQLRNGMAALEASHGINIALVLIQWGQWQQVKPLLTFSRTWSALCFLMPREIGGALCDEMQKRVDIMAESVRLRGALVETTPASTNNDTDGSDSIVPMDTEETATPTTEIDRAISEISDFANCISPAGCIASRPDLYRQLCRLLVNLMKEKEKKPTEAEAAGGEANTNLSDEAEQQTHELSNEAFAFFKDFLVPSLTLFPRDPALATDLWSVLKQLPYTTRYELYQAWEGVGLEKVGLRGSTPFSGKFLPLLKSECVAGKSARSSLKRLTKDNVGAMGKEIVNDTHSAPLVVYTTILNQIESYDNLIDVMVESQRQAGPLGLDVLGYSILRRLRGSSGGVNRDVLKGMIIFNMRLLNDGIFFAAESTFVRLKIKCYDQCGVLTRRPCFRDWTYDHSFYDHYFFPTLHSPTSSS